MIKRYESELKTNKLSLKLYSVLYIESYILLKTSSKLIFSRDIAISVPLRQ